MPDTLPITKVLDLMKSADDAAALAALTAMGAASSSATAAAIAAESEARTDEDTALDARIQDLESAEIVSGDISDATVFGKSLLVTENRASARALLGVSVPQLGPSLIPFGDSITANGVPVSPGVPAEFGATAWFWWAACYAGAVLNCPYVAGYAGYTTTQLLPLFQADVVNRSPAACTIMAGTNDADGTSATTIANLQSMYEQAFAGGVYVYALTILPRPTVSTAKKQDICIVNAWIAEYWQSRMGQGECVDAFAALVDPSSTTQATVAGALRDNVHPGPKGAQLIGHMLGQRFIAKAMPRYPLLSSIYDDRAVNSLTNNMVRNGLGLSPGAASGTGVSGTIPANWSPTCTNCTVVCSTEARADGFGNNGVFAITFSAAGNFYVQFPAISNMTVGKRIRFAAAINLASGATRIRAIELLAYPGFTNAGSGGSYNGSDDDLLGSGVEYALIGPLSSPKAVGGAFFGIKITSAAAGSCTLRIGRVSGREHT